MNGAPRYRSTCRHSDRFGAEQHCMPPESDLERGHFGMLGSLPLQHLPFDIQRLHTIGLQPLVVFQPQDAPGGPYGLRLSMIDSRLALDITGKDFERRLVLSLTPLRGLIKDSPDHLPGVRMLRRVDEQLGDVGGHEREACGHAAGPLGGWASTGTAPSARMADTTSSGDLLSLGT